MTPTTLALVGAGAIARSYFAALRGSTRLVAVAVVEPDPTRRADAAAELGVPGYADLATMLAAGAPDAAIVMTPPVTHEATSIALLDAGLHVLCEKPLAVSTAAALRMIAAARRADRRLMMASKFRYVADVLRARALVADGLIGRLLLFENAFCSRVDMTRRWNSDPAIAGGGVLIDNGCHSVDIARFLCGPLARIQAQFAVPTQDLRVEDTARILFESECGAMGAIDLSWSLHKEITSFVRLYGSEGTLEIGWQRSRHKRAGQDEWESFGAGYDKLAAFRAQLEDFAATIRGEVEPRITLEDALWSVRAIDAAYCSARTTKWVPIEPRSESP